jgi:alanyl-tRNA synthetase
MRAQELRRAWSDFWVERGHRVYPSAGLIPHHRRAPLFTNAGMNQFLPYILGEEPPPDPPRATSIQKCVRVKGKHDDIEEVGRSPWHLSFFEMMGNFSLGDYFKEGAIPFAWELCTEVYGLDPERIWVTVHDTDDEAEAIWHEVVGVSLERIQRLGEDNFWEMGETGPCGPCSELFYDKGDAFGAAGGPAHGAPARYPEFWNLVFMQYDRQADGTLADLPMKVIDTGAGLERNLVLLQDTASVWDTDELRALIDAAARATGKRYGDDPEVDVTLRVLADHGRTMTFLVDDGVFPSNEDRGYVLRRIIRRAVRKAYQLGVEQPVAPQLATATAEVMQEAYPELTRHLDAITNVVAREEERFRQTLKAGTAQLEEELARSGDTVSGEAAFKLHDTYGFPIDLTREIAGERGVTVDLAGFESAMEQQRRRAKDARKVMTPEEADLDTFREVLDQFGPTDFTGYREYESPGRVVRVIALDGGLDVVLDRTPFYAESGGQVGDTGLIRTESGVLEVLDTTLALPGLHRHRARLVEGEVHEGQDAVSAIHTDRREAIRRNHTGTHLLHAALREVLGGHVKQQGSLVGPDYLRFDFSHHEPVRVEEIDVITGMVNADVLANDPVRAFETTKQQADQMGALAFFGDKYGEYVRVVEAGNRSVELCGGTHVGALGMIGTIRVTTEQSIGANLRRIFALTGTGTLDQVRREREILDRAAELLRATPEEVPETIERLLQRQRDLESEMKALQTASARGDAGGLISAAVEGKVVARKDGMPPDQLKALAQAVLDGGVETVVLIGSPDGKSVALVARAQPGVSPGAPELVGPAAKVVGGGGGGSDPTQAVAGGRDVGKIDDALDDVRKRLGLSG